MQLYELRTRPWEAMTEDERKRIELYEAFVKGVSGNTVMQLILRNK